MENSGSNHQGVVRRTEVAIEELRQLQSIITRLENQEYAIRRWLMTVFAALIAIMFSADGHSWQVEPMEFLVASVSTSLLFLIVELAQRVPKRKAIRRAGVVEEMLRGESDYDGPKIALSLSEDPDFRGIVVDEMRNAHVVAFYLPLTLVAGTIALIAWLT